MQAWHALRRYEVKGVGRESGRQRKRIYEERDEDAARRRAEAEGTVVESVTDLGVVPPTEPQLAYANGVGITIPEGASAADVSNLLTNYEEGWQRASETEFQLARDFGLEPPSQYMGQPMLSRFIRESLEPDQLIQWYLYLVFLRRANRGSRNRIKSPVDPEIVRLAHELKADPKAVASIRRRAQLELSVDGLSADNTYAYQEAVRILAPFVDPPKEPRDTATNPPSARKSAAAHPRQSKAKAKASKQNPTLWGVVILLLILFWIFL